MTGAGVRWIVDGMNVIGARPDGWWRDRDAAARRLAGSVADLAARIGEPILLVLDGPPPEPPPEEREGLTVVVAPGRGRNAADDEIVRIVSESADPSRLRVATSDAGLAERVGALGAAVEGAGAFRRRLDAP